MGIARRFGALVAVGVFGVLFSGGERYGAVSGCRPQRAAMGGMSDIREKTD